MYCCLRPLPPAFNAGNRVGARLPAFGFRVPRRLPAVARRLAFRFPLLSFAGSRRLLPPVPSPALLPPGPIPTLSSAFLLSRCSLRLSCQTAARRSPLEAFLRGLLGSGRPISSPQTRRPPFQVALRLVSVRLFGGKGRQVENPVSVHKPLPLSPAI